MAGPQTIVWPQTPASRGWGLLPLSNALQTGMTHDCSTGSCRTGTCCQCKSLPKRAKAIAAESPPHFDFCTHPARTASRALPRDPKARRVFCTSELGFCTQWPGDSRMPSHHWSTVWQTKYYKALAKVLIDGEMGNQGWHRRS